MKRMINIESKCKQYIELTYLLYIILFKFYYNFIKYIKYKYNMQTMNSEK